MTRTRNEESLTGSLGERRAIHNYVYGPRRKRRPNDPERVTML